MRPVLLHYHILKNGGSTVEEILRRSLGAQFCSFDHPHRDAEIKPAEIVQLLERNPAVTAFSSHQIFYPVPRAPGFLFFDICFLRDPFDRIRSIYDYFRGKPAEDDPIRLLAQRHTLRDFVRRLIDEMPWTVNDVQVNLLANGLVNDTPRGAGDLDLATRRMLETSFLGVVDCFEESLVAGEYAARTLFPAVDCAQERVNDSARPGSTLPERLKQFREDCGEDVFSEISRLNAMDDELLRRARAEIRRRFELVPQAEERLRQLKEGVSAAPPRARKIRKTIPATASGDWARGLRFLADLRRSRPGSEFRRLFDADYYRETNPGVNPGVAGPLWHFVTRGAFEGRDPHPLFDTKFYLSQCAEAPDLDALSEYLKRGGRPHPLFDPEYYTRRYPDVRQARINPLLHYVLHGAAEGRKPNPLFAPDFYLAGCAEARQSKNPLLHFLENEAANPHPLFDLESYRRAYNTGTTENPLVEYLRRPEESRPVSKIPAANFPAARFTIEEVEIAIVFPKDEFDSLPEAEQRAIQQRAGAAIVWRDACGRKKFLCEPQQTRFFECARYDQLAAQINGTLAGTLA